MVEGHYHVRLRWPKRGRLHAGRSRNDQVLAALRLYLRDATQALHDGAIEVAAALDALAAREGSIALPGYTHMQQAMPSTVSLWALGFAAEIRDDAEGLKLAQRRSAKNPLGSAAGYGTPNLDVSRESTRLRLGFTATQEPVTAGGGGDFTNKFLIVTYKQSGQSVDAVFKNVVLRRLETRVFLVGEYATPDANEPDSLWKGAMAWVPVDGIEAIHTFSNLENACKVAKNIKKPESSKPESSKK